MSVHIAQVESKCGTMERRMRTLAWFGVVEVGGRSIRLDASRFSPTTIKASADPPVPKIQLLSEIRYADNAVGISYERCDSLASRLWARSSPHGPVHFEQ